MNEIELKGIYSYNKEAITSLDQARNLGYELGASTNKDNKFDAELSLLIEAGIITKMYDFNEGGYREGLYNFTNETAQISFQGNDHMGLSLSYCY